MCSMNLRQSNAPVFLDCTLRDGGYYNNWDFPSDLIADYLKAMLAISADYIEIGFRSFCQQGFKGGAAYSTDMWIRSLAVPKALKIGVMVNASEVVNHPEGVVPALQKMFAPAKDSPVSLVRLACHVHEFAAALPGCAWLKEQGYVAGVNLMQISDRSQQEIVDIGKLASGYPLDVLYFADSMGGMDPEQTKDIVKSLRVHWQGALGIHTHDNMGQALPNSMRAIVEGATWVDGTVTGMGRGPGNAKTEYLVIAMEPFRTASYNIAPLLSLISKHFGPMQAKYGWGSNPYYYLAGKYGIHPSYIQEMLTDSRYSEEDLLAVIDHLKTVGGKKFSTTTLESARHFYSGDARGIWQPASVIAGRDVLILGTGPGIVAHRAALEDYIRAKRPYVLALNTQTSIMPDLIDARAACHPMRLLADCKLHAQLPQPLITPASMLPERVLLALAGKKLLDYGLGMSEDTFNFAPDYCTLPTSLVIAYAIAIATSGQAARILLAGFDGYGADDPRTVEMDALLCRYQQASGALPLMSITPTRYSVPTTSVYVMTVLPMSDLS